MYNKSKDYCCCFLYIFYIFWFLLISTGFVIFEPEFPVIDAYIKGIYAAVIINLCIPYPFFIRFKEIVLIL